MPKADYVVSVSVLGVRDGQWCYGCNRSTLATVTVGMAHGDKILGISTVERCEACS